MEYSSIILQPQDVAPNLYWYPLCRDKINPEYIRKVVNSALHRYIGLAFDNDKLVGFVLCIGPISSLDIDRVGTLMYTNPDYDFVAYGSDPKYAFIERDGLVFWREVLCVDREYGGTGIVQRFEQDLENYIRSFKVAAVLGTDTPYKELIPYFEREGFEVVFHAGRLNPTTVMKKIIV